MITPEQRRYIEWHAYVPEHLPAYVTAITAARPHLFGDYVAYAAGDRLIFVGYPLSGVYDEAAWLAALDAATARLRPRLIAITAAALPASLADCPASPPDAYYRLDLADVRPDKKLRNLLRRAERELTVHVGGRFGPEHRRLVAAFLARTPVDEGTRFIFERVERYAGGKTGLEALAGLVCWARDRLKLRVGRETSPPGPALQGEISLPGPVLRGETATPGPPHREGEGGEVPSPPSHAGNWGAGRPGAPLILEARDAAGRLAAFDIATCAAGEFAFYLFNFRAPECYVPGASDLLLARLIELARAAGKRTLNLGLGINAGVRGFKEKWGATPFLPHVACVRERPRAAWEEVVAGAVHE